MHSVPMTSPTPLKSDYSNLQTSGRFVVEASAGTGKTYSILRIYLRYLLDRWSENDDIDIDRLLLVTFTNAATYELRERLLEFLQECYTYCSDPNTPNKIDPTIVQIIQSYTQSNLFTLPVLSTRFQHFLADFDRAPVYTIHAFCGRIQTDWFPQVGLPIESRNRMDSQDLLEDICKDYWRKWMHSTNSEDHLLAQYLRHYFERPLNEGLGYTQKSLLSKINGIERYLKIDLNPAPKPWEETRTLLKNIKEGFQKLQEKFKGKIAQQIILSELERAKKQRDNEGRSLKIANYLNEGYQLKTLDQLKYATKSKLIKDSNKTDYQPASWTYDLEQLNQNFDELEKAEAAILSRVLFELHAQISKKIQRESLSTHDLDLKLTLQGLQQNPDLGQLLAQQYPCILVDEFQDTDKVQFELFDRIFRASKVKNKVMYFIGDPKQSIYRFRNADINTYLKAKKLADQVYSLNTNYRSSEQAVKSVNSLFGAIEHPTSAFDEPNIPFDPVEVKGTQQELRSPDSVISTKGLRLIIPKFEKENTFSKAKALEWIAQEIEKYLDPEKGIHFYNQETKQQSPILAKDIAVLVKSHKDAQALKDLLAKRRISAVLYSRPTVFTSDESRWLSYLIDAILEPKNLNYIKRALSTPFFEVDAQRFIEWAKLSESAEDILSYQKAFAEWRDLWTKKSILYLIQNILNTESTRERIVGLDQGDRVLTNILQIAELLDEYEQHKGASTLAVSQYLKLKRQRAKRRDEDEEDEVRLDTDDELIKIMTVFRSKGLEFPIVFTALNFELRSNRINTWLEQPSIDTETPIQEKSNILSQNAEKIIIGKEQKLGFTLKVLDTIQEPTIEEFQSIEQAREAIRQFYVALTRAKFQTIAVEYCGRTKEIPIIPAHLLVERAPYIPAKKNEKYKNPLFFDKSSIYDTLAQNKGDFSIEEVSATSYEAASYFSSLKSDKNVSEESVTGDGPKNRTELPKLAVNAGWRINSYSGLNHYLSHSSAKISVEEQNAKDHDEEEGSKTLDNNDKSDFSIFSFEKGSNAGTFMHELFELLDFHRFEDAKHRKEVIEQACEKHGYEAKAWHKTLERMVNLSMTRHINIGGEQIQLGKLQPSQILREMEFLFDHQNFDLKSLARVVNPTHAIADERLPAFKGYLTGFIDLCFLHKDKVYILDYKSNYLGNTIEHYSSDRLESDMEKHRYDLQYHIYAYAMHRALQNRIENYQYEKHFGGICYIYLRGLSDQGDNGIYTSTKPSFSTIQQIDQILGGKK